MAKNWEEVRDLITIYYVHQKKPLREVIRIMRDNHGFKASMRSYRQKFKDWNIRKYRRHDRNEWSSTPSNTSYPSSPSSILGPGQQRYQQQQQHTHPAYDQYIVPNPDQYNQFATSDDLPHTIRVSGDGRTRYSHAAAAQQYPALTIRTPPQSESGRTPYAAALFPHADYRRSSSNATQPSPGAPAPLGSPWNGAGPYASPVSVPSAASPGQFPSPPRLPPHELFPYSGSSHQGMGGGASGQPQPQQSGRYIAPSWSQHQGRQQQQQQQPSTRQYAQRRYNGELTSADGAYGGGHANGSSSGHMDSHYESGDRDGYLTSENAYSRPRGGPDPRSYGGG